MFACTVQIGVEMKSDKVLVSGYIAYEAGFSPCDLDDLYLEDGVAKTPEQAIAWWANDTARDPHAPGADVVVAKFTVTISNPKKYRWTLTEVTE